MRRSALALLVTSTSCNWAFGLSATVVVDAPPGSPDAPDAPPDITSRIMWGVVTTDGTGTPDAVIELVPIGSETARPATPVVQIGPELGNGPLMDVSYAPADGAIAIPYTLRMAPHRIVYAMPGESLQHEVQWAITGATLVIPRLTRKDAPVPPPDSGYHVTPTGLVEISVPSLYTSGVFTFDQRPESFTQNLAEQTYVFASHASPLAGPVGSPQTAHGDWQMIAGWAARSAFTATLEGYALFSVDLAAGGPSTPAAQPTWVKTMPLRRLSTASCPGVDCFPSVGISSTETRLTNALGGLAGPSFKYRMKYGVAPSLKSPAFVPGAGPDFVGAPVILPFAQSTNLDATIDLVDPSGDLPSYERVFYAHIGTTRTTNGVGLLSYVQAMTSTFSGQLQFTAPLVKTVKLGATDLSGASDSVAHAASSQPIDLTFSPESPADAYVVTLYEIAGNALSPIRVYHVISPVVKVDASLLVTGHTYVFGITTHVGIPNARNGSFEAVTYPFGEATTFPRTFTIVP